MPDRISYASTYVETSVMWSAGLNPVETRMSSPTDSTLLQVFQSASSQPRIDVSERQGAMESAPSSMGFALAIAWRFISRSMVT